MSYPLAIFAPIVGGLSETFIRRHMQDLLAGRTAVVAQDANKPWGGHWTVDGPHLILNRIEAGRVQRYARAIAGRCGYRPEHDWVRGRVKAFLQEHHVRVVVGEFLSWSLEWLELANELGIRFFGHAHGFDVSANLCEPKWRREYVRYGRADGIITMSEYSRLRLIELGLEARKIHVIPYGVDVQAEPPAREAGEQVRCLIVGRMVSKKPPILNLDAFRRAADICPALHLDYVGAGELLPAAQQFVRAFGLEDRVTLLGGQPADVVASLMKRADVFLLHSMTDPLTGDQEGLPVSILEAMGHALPVISTRHAGIPEAVSEGSTGLLVDEGDSKGMAQCLIALARDARLRRTMGDAGWRVARDRFTWQRERSDLHKILGLDERRVSPAAN